MVELEERAAEDLDPNLRCESASIMALVETAAPLASSR